MVILEFLVFLIKKLKNQNPDQSSKTQAPKQQLLHIFAFRIDLANLSPNFIKIGSWENLCVPSDQ